MPVQLTLRNPKGGRILHEREYAYGTRLDAVSGWLVVVDRHGSVIAAHAACPGLEGAIVEHASAAVDDGQPEHYCPTCHQRTAIPVEPDPPDGYEANLDALRAEVARLTALLDDASREADRADRAEERLASMTGRRNRAREHAVRNDSEVEVLRAEVDEQTTRAEQAEQLVASYRRQLDATAGEAIVRDLRFAGHPLQVARDPVPHEPVDVRPVDEDPRRPSPSVNAWPDDAVLLRYVELRRLVSLHLERYGDASSARAMLEGDVPLRLGEVLDR
jgi:hypothetical protein